MASAAVVAARVARVADRAVVAADVAVELQVHSGDQEAPRVADVSRSVRSATSTRQCRHHPW